MLLVCFLDLSHTHYFLTIPIGKFLLRAWRIFLFIICKPWLHSQAASSHLVSARFFCLIFNGAVAGYAVASAKTVLSWTQVGLRILPHGLFEIPAMLFWAAAGFSSCTWIYTRIRGIPLERAFWADVVALLGAGGLLLVVAAIIEGTVTYRLALIQ